MEGESHDQKSDNVYNCQPPTPPPPILPSTTVKKAADAKVLFVMASIVDVNHISIKTLYFHHRLCVPPSFHIWLSQISGLNNMIFLQVTKFKKGKRFRKENLKFLD
ncbi:unnamed protein product [Lactuca virosa]|uniref:Uncharacterized protein n=1 Tax=Lactuca virosa TaxID=75947 RepID=A0AAU9P078_9ASTR|nr:unnamed protein product [Lactuca virosa]